MTDTQREIKFRAWDKNPNCPYPMIANPLQRCDAFDVLNKKSIYKDWVLMQFTGLLDKNGKEIYEGDILRVLYTDWPSQLDTFPDLSHEEYLYSLSGLGVVVFSGDRFAVDFNKGSGTSSIFEGEYGFKKVIGNIYENPELLKD